MKIALFTGTAYRHLYYANKILNEYEVALHVKMCRSNKITEEVDIACSAFDKKLLQDHSNSRLKKERKYFLPLAEKQIAARQIIEVSESELNGPMVFSAIEKINPDVVLVYGTRLLQKKLLQIMPFHTINLHAGLNPYYRGATTLYWPIYLMEPQYLGFTLHLIDEKIDNGLIIHQNRPRIFPDDELHDLGCRTIVQAADDIIKILEKIEAKQIKYYKPEGKNRVFYGSYFKPHHLRVTNYLMKNGLIKEYWENNSRFPDPKIISQV